MSAQQINISLSNDTIQALQQQGYALYALRGFNSTSAAGKPLVWVSSTGFAQTTTIETAVKYEAYMAQGDGGIIVQMVSAPVQLGQTATLGGDFEIGVTPTGKAGAVALINGTTRPLTTGLAVPYGGPAPAPICAAPLYGLGEVIVAPLDQYLLTFSTQGLGPGAPIEHAMSQSLLIDLGQQASVKVSYDINTGWNADGAPWARLVPAGTPLAPLLAHQMPMR